MLKVVLDKMIAPYAMLAAADVTLSAALATLVGAAAPADELTQMSSTLRRLRQHLSTPVPVVMPAGR
jgi:hypothetical protein